MVKDKAIRGPWVTWNGQYQYFYCPEGRGRILCDSPQKMLDLRDTTGWQVRKTCYSFRSPMRQYRNKSFKFCQHNSVKLVAKFLQEKDSHLPLSEWKFNSKKGTWKSLKDKWQGSVSVPLWASTLHLYGPVPSVPMRADQIQLLANEAWTTERSELRGESCSILYQNGTAVGDVVSYCAYSSQFGSAGFAEAICQFCNYGRNPTMVLVDAHGLMTHEFSRIKQKLSPITICLKAFRRADDATAFEREIQLIMESQMDAPHFLHRIAGHGPKTHNAQMALLIHRVFITFFLLDGEVSPDGRTGTINEHDVRFTHYDH